MHKRLYWILILCSSLTFGQEAALTGRWLFQGLSDSGRKVPLFIVEFPASGKASVLATTAPFEIQVDKFSLNAGLLTLQLLADGQPLTLKGAFENGIINGKTDGQNLSGLSFVAERTEKADLKRLNPPDAAEQEAFQAAQSAPDAQQKISGLRGFLDKYPETALRTSALLQILEAGLESSHPEDKLTAIVSETIESTDDKAVIMNDIAYLMAEKNLMLPKAEELARGATGQARPGSKARGSFLDTLGWVLYRRGKLDEAASTLQEAMKIAPREADIALHLAEILEKQGKNLEAVGAYLQAHVGGGNRQAKVTARNLYRKEKGSTEGFHDLLDQVYAKQPPLFNPGRHEGEHSGPTLVAELFTGAQCGPCQAADYAFDGLIERFPETTVNVLQYHLHVPGPDPMTSPDSIARARFYKIRSTPIAVFSGVDQRPGGGPSALAELAFRKYLDAINAQLKPGDKAQVDFQVKSEKDVISVSGKVELPATLATEDLRLHIALVERTIHYTGSNGVHFHRNVVRKLLNGSQGTRLTGPDFEFKQTASLTAIEEEIKQYLDEVTKDWGMPFPEAPTGLIRNDLAVAAFVQNAQTQQILGSAMAPVKSTP